MKQCIYCGAELADDARACNNCGRPVPDMPETAAPAEVKELPAEEPAGPARQQSQQADPEQQTQPQDPWGRDMPQQDPWGRQFPQQDPWGQQSPQQGQWGQQPPQQDPWGQQSPQQNPWGQPQQDPWGRPLNGSDPNRPGPDGQIPGFGTPYAGYGGRQTIQKRYHMFAVWSLLFGIISAFLNGIVFIPSILAIVFAIIAIIQIRKNPQQYGGTGMAIIGLVLGVVFLIMYGYVFKMVFQAVQNPETMEQLQNYLQEISRR